jgi:hypothetical protein
MDLVVSNVEQQLDTFVPCQRCHDQQATPEANCCFSATALMQKPAAVWELDEME